MKTSLLKMYKASQERERELLDRMRRNIEELRGTAKTSIFKRN